MALGLPRWSWWFKGGSAGRRGRLVRRRKGRLGPDFPRNPLVGGLPRRNMRWTRQRIREPPVSGVVDWTVVTHPFGGFYRRMIGSGDGGQWRQLRWRRQGWRELVPLLFGLALMQGGAAIGILYLTRHLVLLLRLAPLACLLRCFRRERRGSGHGRRGVGP